MRLKLFTFLSIFLLSSQFLKAQTYYEHYQDGLVVFQIKLDAKRILSTKKKVDFTNYPLFTEFLGNYSIEEVKHLHPELEDELLNRVYQIKLTDFSKVDEVIKKLNTHPTIEYVELKVLHRNLLVPNDYYYNITNQYGLFKIQAEQAWDLSVGNSNVVVAVTDNAIDVDHPDLAGIFVNGRDVVYNDNNPRPCGTNVGLHGTHVSGTVGSKTNNGTGIASIGNGISVMPVKIGNCDSLLTGAYDGIVYAAQNGADIINMSWGGSQYSNYGQNVVTNAWNAGSILVASAGNKDESAYNYPASYNNVISVASTDVNDNKSSFSNYGTWVDIAAPGSAILSTDHLNGYSYLSGTSMASPLVAGLLGLMKSYVPLATNAELISCLYSSADDISAQNPTYYGQLGAGRINAFAALTCLSGLYAQYDLAIQSIISPIGTLCENDFVPQIELFNNGAATLTSGVIKYNWGGPIRTFNWTGNLPPGQSIVVTLATETAASGSYVFSATVSLPNGQPDENSLNNTFTTNFSTSANGEEVTLILDTDCWGDETTWEIRDNSNSLVASGGPYAGGVFGTYNTIDLCLVDACYTFTIFDSDGDGMSGGQYASCGINGYYEMQDADGAVLFAMTVPNFGYSSSHTFCTTPQDPPVPNISANNNQVCPGGTVSFTDQSLNSPTSWYWTFPGGSPATSTLQNPTVTYTTSGSYDVTLQVGNAGGAQTTTFTNQVTVNNPPQVNATATITTLCAGQSTNLSASGATSYSWSNGLGSGSSHSVSPTTTTTYTVTGSNGSCTNTATVQVIVTPVTTVGLTASQTTICAGGAVTLSSSGAGAYSWNNGLGSGNSHTVSPTTTTTYTVTGSNGSCSNTASVQVIVTPGVTVGLIASQTNICVGNAVTLSASGAGTYSWSNGLGGGSSHSVSPTTTTTYTVTGTNGTCSANAAVTVVVDAVPTVSATVTSTTICAGQSTSLSASGATSYLWSNGLGNGSSQSVSPTTTTTYTVTGSNGSCSNTATVQVIVTPGITVGLSASQNEICVGSTVTLSASGANTYTWNNGLGAGSSHSIAPTTTTTYSVTGSGGNCTNNASVTVVVKDVPNLQVSASNYTLCKGENTTLMANGADNYVWSPASSLNTTTGSSVVASPTTTTTFTVMGSNNCGIGNQTVSITVSPSPAVPSINQNGDVLSVTLQPGESAQWFMGASLVGSGPSLTIAQNGSYNVIISNSDGCTSSATDDFVIGTSGLTTNDVNGQLKVYPNPTENTVHVSWEGVELIESIRVYDAIGREVLNLHGINNNSLTIDLSPFVTGVYVVHIKTKSSTMSKKITKR